MRIRPNPSFSPEDARELFDSAVIDGIRCLAPLARHDPSEATDLAYRIVQAARDGLAVREPVGEYARADQIDLHLERALAELRVALRYTHPGRGEPDYRRMGDSPGGARHRHRG